MRHLMIAIVLLGGCDSQEPSPPDAAEVFADAPVLVSISVTPTSASLAPGATLQLTVTGHYTGGSTTDLTFRAMFDSTPTTVATVSSYVGLGGDRGLVTAQTTGTATITATVLGSPATATITVVP